MNRKGYRHFIPIQLRFKDQDSMGHINNANHFTYMELARVHYFHDVITLNNDWSQNGLILAKMNIDYISPLLMGDETFVFTRCSRIGNKSFDLEYELVKKVNGNLEESAKGFSVIVCYDYAKGKSIAVPDEWRKRMAEYEGLKL